MRLSAHALAVLAATAPAKGDVAAISGTIDSSDPQMGVVAIIPPDCSIQVVTPVHYEIYPSHVALDGTYTIQLTSAGGFAAFYLYEIAFDANNGTLNCIAADNDGDPREVIESLTAFRQYFVVPFDDTFVQSGGTFDLTIEGPGAIRPGGVAVVEIPTLSQWGALFLSAVLALGGLTSLRRRRGA